MDCVQIEILDNGDNGVVFDPEKFSNKTLIQSGVNNVIILEGIQDALLGMVQHDLDESFFRKELDDAGGYFKISHGADFIIKICAVMEHDTEVDVTLRSERFRITFKNLKFKKGTNDLPLFGRLSPIYMSAIPYASIYLYFSVQPIRVEYIGIFQSINIRFDFLSNGEYFINIIDEKHVLVTWEGCYLLREIETLDCPLRKKLKRLRLTQIKNLFRKCLPGMLKKIYRPEGQIASRLADAFFP